MNKQQISTLQLITANIQAAHHDGAMTFKVMPHVVGIMLWASNVNDQLRWFEKASSVGIFIGPRGGITGRFGDKHLCRMAAWTPRRAPRLGAAIKQNRRS